MRNKINILYIIDELNIGGTENQLIATIALLNRNRFVPHLVCLRPSKYYFEFDTDCRKQVLCVYSLFSLNGFLKLLKLILYLRNNKVDIVQTYFFDSNLFGVLAAKLAFVKTVISCRRDLGFWYTSKLLITLRTINKLTTRILANSYAVKDNVVKCEKVSENRIDVIKNGIDINLFSRSLHKESNSKPFEALDKDYIVGIVANLNRYVKRVDVFIKSASEVLKIIPNVSFQIVGDGHLRDDLERLVEKLNIDHKISFLGRRNDIQSIIETWDIGVISSDSEGFSNSILEYMALGIPVIATNAGGNSEVIEKGVNGLLVAPGDYGAMAIGIYNLLCDSKRRSMMSDNAMSLIRREYVWNSKIKEIESYYRNLI